MNKNIVVIVICLFLGENIIYAQNSLRDEFIKSSKSKYEAYKKGQEEAYKKYTKEQNEAYANYIKASWQLFEDYKMHTSPFTEPKFKKVPIAPNAEYNDKSDLNREYNDFIVDISIHEDSESYNDISIEDSIIKSLTNGYENYSSTQVEVDFYGEDLVFNVGNNLFLNLSGVYEDDVANYFLQISEYEDESLTLWNDISRYSTEFGLNEWGEYLMLKILSEKMFVSNNERVAFCFYMLRNYGFYKTKIARGSQSQNLILLIAIDNTKKVYGYKYFSFNEDNVDIKYYVIYGDKMQGEGIYTYNVNEQDINLAQIGLEFNKILAIGRCDKVRSLNVERLNSTINLPYNSRNINFLNEVPQTIFPIYFVSDMTEEAQQALYNKFGHLKHEYSATEAVDILLNFVQTAFDYQTDNEQFGCEKYFYPEESIAYPYCDCEDRSALFSWLVKTYLGLQVVGLKYPGHLATAVYFGENIELDGNEIVYQNKKYYVCDPTYIGASVGMTMPQFKNVDPIIVVE